MLLRTMLAVLTHTVGPDRKGTFITEALLCAALHHPMHAREDSARSRSNRRATLATSYNLVVSLSRQDQYTTEPLKATIPQRT